MRISYNEYIDEVVASNNGNYFCNIFKDGFFCVSYGNGSKFEELLRLQEYGALSCSVPMLKTITSLVLL